MVSRDMLRDCAASGHSCGSLCISSASSQEQESSGRGRVNILSLNFKRFTSKDSKLRPRSSSHSDHSISILSAISSYNEHYQRCSGGVAAES